MRSLELQGSFGAENLAFCEGEVPEVGRGQVLVQIRAACLNYRDWLMVQGQYNPKQPLPLVPCSDGVGVVQEVGEGVSRVASGDRVCPLFVQGWLAGEPPADMVRWTLGGPLNGTLTEYMVLPEHSVVKVPEHLSDAQAATLPCAAVTAWSALVTLGQVKAGDVVLLQGTGGVSIFGLQFAKSLGARVILTSSSDQKLERARQLGADETINYKEQPEWGKLARSMTEAGVDHIIEVGGAGTLAQSLKAIRVGGQISLIGVLAGAASKLNILPIFMRQVRIQGLLVGHRESFEAMNRAIAHHQIEPVVDQCFSWEDTPAAFEQLSQARHFGKICVEIS